jgi:hypothetical protein
MPGYESYQHEEVLADLIKTAARIRTTPMDADWKSRLEPEIQDAITDPARQQLRDKLLSYGGEEALVRTSDIPSDEITRLMTRGEFWTGSKADFNKMRAINCHGNSVCLMEKGLGEVVNGYALSQDGMWRNHSWLLQSNGRLIETTVRRKAYFGVVLSREEVAAEYSNI